MTLSSPEQSGRQLSYPGVCKQESLQVVLSIMFPHTETILAFPFTDPAEQLLLTGLDDSCFREAVKLVWSVQTRHSLSVVSPQTGFYLCDNCLPFPLQSQ